MAEEAIGDESGASATATAVALAPPVAAWRRQYWRLHARGQRAWRELHHARILRGLRRRARSVGRFVPGEIDIDGLHVHYDDMMSLCMEYKHIFAWGIYDFRPPGPRPLVLDCGSHTGMSLLRFKRLAPDCRVIAFEPDPHVLPLLRANIAANRLQDVEVVPAALAGAPGPTRFVADGADGGRLVGGAAGGDGGCSVATAALRDYLIEPVDLLKMNIEGAECDVLLAAADRLHNVRQLVVEYHGFPDCGQRLHELLALLDGCGFRYLLHHLDYETNPAVRPPFDIRVETRFFTIVAATRLWDRTPPPAAPAKPRLEPISRQFGLDRGTPVDRHYIADFLGRHADDVRGRVLEVGDATYTRRFGGERVTQRDVLNPTPVPGTTVVADLADAEGVPAGAFDCFILTQTLPFIFDVRAAVRQAWRGLKPGGVLLATVPGISQISRFDADRWGDFWRFTPQGMQRLLGECFGAQNVETVVYGNFRSAGALLDGRAAEELSPDELSPADQDYPVIIAARAVRGD